MNVGDRVTNINLLGTIVGVGTNGNPVIEWDLGEYTDEDPSTLIKVELPEDNEKVES